MKKALIIGGGAAGCAAAISLASKSNWDIDLIEKGPSLGAGVWTNFKSGHPYTYGPRHFLTHNQEVFDFMNNIVPLRLCAEHQFYSFVEDDGNFYNYPIHEDDFSRMPDENKIRAEIDNLDKSFKDKEFKLTVGAGDLDDKAKNYEDFWIKSVGESLYEKFIKTYTQKMWQVEDNSVIDDFTWSPKGVAIKKGPREGWDTAISAYPKNISGYNNFFLKAKDCANVSLETAVDQINEQNNEAVINGNTKKYDIIINSTPIDHLLNYRFGKLKYIGRDITFIMLPVEFALPKDVYFCYYVGKEKYTRVVEYKKFTQYRSPHTLISLEYPSNNGRLYPMPTSEDKSLANKYFDCLNENIFCIGRIGAYNYRYDIDDALEQAIMITKNL